MIVPQSLKWRMQFWYGLLLAASLTGFGWFAFHQQKKNDLARIELALERETTFMLGELREDLRGPRRGPPPRPAPPVQRLRALREFLESDRARELLANNGLEADYFILWDRDGTELGRLGDPPEEIPFPQAEQGEGSYNVQRTREDFREVYRFRSPGDCLLLGKSLHPERQQWRSLAWQLAASGLGILALGLIGGWAFLSHSLRPVHSIGRAARRFASGNLETRIPREKTGGELGQLTRDLNETFELLERAFARQSRFTADAAHELRTPVSVILSHAQVALARERTPEAYREALASCERGAKRLRELIDSLLSLTRIEADAGEASNEEADLADLAGEGIAFLESKATEKQISLVSDLAAAGCLGRPDRLRQVLLNLITNAISFSSEGSSVRVSTGQDESHAWVAIADEGTGIPEEHIPNIFDRFYRVDPSRRREGGGAGLGLAICAEIVEDHGGTIEVESAEGAGSTFTVRIPRSDSAAPDSGSPLE